MAPTHQGHSELVEEVNIDEFQDYWELLDADTFANEYEIEVEGVDEVITIPE
ncbi:hypothetical protein APHAL10511_008711 [Amanita phalloides]|nr:hypothetical protein APHAL10511_008711 [Amanita phalloides]